MRILPTTPLSRLRILSLRHLYPNLLYTYIVVIRVNYRI